MVDRLRGACPASLPLHRVSRGPPPRAGEDIVARARACVGARFRMQGRDPEIGLDCVGLAAFAFDLEAPPAGYALRGGNPEALAYSIGAAGLITLDPALAGTGDLLMVLTGPRQFHLLMLHEGGFIHADARLRRVTDVPGNPPWPVLAAWRMR